MVNDAVKSGTTSAPTVSSPANLELRQIVHRAVDAVTGDLMGLRFNRAIARIYEVANALGSALQVGNPPPELKSAIREAADILVLMFAPMMPHLAEECWRVLGHETAVVNSPWPKPDPALVARDEVTIAVQVNGKRRDEITVAKELDPKVIEAMALQLDSVRRALDGRSVKKVIVVPGRIINIVG
jgi:leucyl-tRNA synthetase